MPGRTSVVRVRARPSVTPGGADDGTSGAVPNGLPFLCIGSGFVDFQGGLPLTAPGVALVFLSTVGMLFNARPTKTWGGV